ncbi:uncharacterized protein LOC111370251 [Olea europaea var. sylvestris]|uniref:uncharacterized protein LOC111370251 n=1 Tax=Olea europaea var. sylvestris TaxID=158386 RepID=UPI000C1CF930|nr:uncharacterized protein LOC111370251 [Olea europaea var. sylvestris]
MEDNTTTITIGKRRTDLGVIIAKYRDKLMIVVGKYMVNQHIGSPQGHLSTKKNEEIMSSLMKAPQQPNQILLAKSNLKYYRRCFHSHHKPYMVTRLELGPQHTKDLDSGRMIDSAEVCSGLYLLRVDESLKGQTYKAESVKLKSQFSQSLVSTG